MWNAISVHGLSPAQGWRSLAGTRLGIGLVQGVVLSLFYSAAERGTWPASNGLAFAPLLLVACFVPLIVIAGLGNMRPRSLAIWASSASALLVLLAMHDIGRAAEVHGGLLGHFSGNAADRAIWPSSMLVLSAAAGLFIAQSLIVASDADLRFIAVYPLYFDTAWRHAVQAALSVAFVGLLWLLLWLGAALFKLIGITSFAAFIAHQWFAWPATTLAFACALHLTEAQAGIMRGTRSLILGLMAWLLPVAALLVAGFLATLPITGLAPLWATRFATGLLLVATAALAVLINLSYQDGLPEHAPPAFLRHAARAAALLLPPLVAIAVYALMLRVAQRGWTSDRVLAAACVMVAAWYAAGYAVSAIGRGAWLRWIERVNVGGAFVVLAVLFALLTPIADPARVSVRDQLARLESGAVSAEKFDFEYLRFEGARYGASALERLQGKQDGDNAATIRRRAQAALDARYRSLPTRVAPTPEELAAHIVVYPTGRSLPQGFLQQDWSRFNSWDLPRCLADSSARCDAYLTDLDRNGHDEIILDDYAQMIVMTADAQGHWQRAGRLVGPGQCDELKAALRSGTFAVATSHWSEIRVGAARFQLAAPPESVDCH